MQVRLLILDIDETAFSSISKRKDKLSQPIIDMAKDGNYNGLYGCTHRSYLTLEFCKNEAIRIAADHDVHDYYGIVNNFHTYKVLPALAKEAGLTLHAISMVDDLIHDGPGVTYETIVRPYEEFQKPAESASSHLSHKDAVENWYTKNPQLKQIATHARELYPEAESIVMDFVDDRQPLCEKALTVSREKGWPEGMALNAFHYDHVEGVLTQIRPQPASSLQANGAFRKSGGTAATTETTTSKLSH